MDVPLPDEIEVARTATVDYYINMRTGEMLAASPHMHPDSRVWVRCEGQWLHKRSMPRLYDHLGGTYGENDNDFRLPDMRGVAA